MSPRDRGSRWLVLSGLLAAALSGCAGRANAPRPAALPSDQVVRRESLEQLARVLFTAIRDQAPEQALAPSAELDSLLPLQSRSRIEQERFQRLGGLAHPGTSVSLWSRASYAGFCAQGAREEGPGGPLGLTQNAWLMDRVLVVAELGGSRSASWVEGRFLFTDHGWRALSLIRVEHPRAGHSDLDLAPCDVEQGIR
jgi:hypothetical protein